MRSCRRWSQADSLVLDSIPRPPAPSVDAPSRPTATANAFRIGGPVTPSSSPAGGHSCFGGGGSSSLLTAYTTPTHQQQQLPSLPLSQSPQMQLPTATTTTQGVTAAATGTDAVGPYVCRRVSPPTLQVADLPAIPESTRWDDDRRLHGLTQRLQPSSDRLERNGSSRTSSGRHVYRTFERRAAAFTTGTTVVAPTKTINSFHHDNPV